MKKLEELLGVHRALQPRQPPDAGREGLYTKISHILGELEAVVSGKLPGRAATAQPLAVGIMLSLGDVHMNRHLAYFQDHHSGASFRVYNLEVREMLQWLKMTVSISYPCFTCRALTSTTTKRFSLGPTTSFASRSRRQRYFHSRERRSSRALGAIFAAV